METFFRPASADTQIDASTLRALAKRAQLRIPPEKEESLCREVGQILNCVHIIQEVRRRLVIHGSFVPIMFLLLLINFFFSLVCMQRSGQHGRGGAARVSAGCATRRSGNAIA